VLRSAACGRRALQHVNGIYARQKHVLQFAIQGHAMTVPDQGVP
jgi:hypothetical protein